jgi:hypothetical protein
LEAQGRRPWSEQTKEEERKARREKKEGCTSACLQLLLVQREVAGLDREHAVAAVAEHVLKLRIPSHAVGVLLLKDLLLGDQVVH